jgi:hypothetical protein
MPLTREYRVFFLDGSAVSAFNYWDEGQYEGDGPPLDEFLSVAREVRSRFFTMDVAERKDGDWIIIELGDGQVAGLPENADVNQLYRALASSASARPDAP